MNESNIQKGILQYLGLKRIYAVRVNSGATVINTPTGNRYIKMAQAGTADILICYNGLFIACEVKTEKGRQSDHQKFAEKQVNESGGIYFIARSIEDVREMLAEVDKDAPTGL